MTQMQAAVLSDRGLVRVSGDDARHFLNGLLSADLAAVSPATPRFAALLTPQGKIVADMIVIADAAEPGGFLLDCPRELVAPLVAKLGFYRLRAKVTVEDASGALAVVALWGDTLTPPGAFAPDPRAEGLGWRAAVAPEQATEIVRSAGAGLVAPAEYEAHRIALGIPRGGVDFTYGDAFPHEADMDQLGGIDFRKGCYVGQEVVSRMQHRGTARSRVVPVRFDAEAPPPGSPVTASDVAAGTMGSSAGGRGLALLRLDRVHDALMAGQPVTAAGTRLTLVRPAWATFAWPGETRASE